MVHELDCGSSTLAVYDIKNILSLKEMATKIFIVLFERDSDPKQYIVVYYRIFISAIFGEIF